MRKILITGGHGFIGSEVVGQFSGEDVKVYSQRIELLNKQALDDVIGVIRPDIVLHIAGAKTAPFDANTIGTSNLVEVSKIFKVKRFVFISTMGIEVMNPDTYSLSKRLAERIVLSEYPDALLLRVGCAYGNGRFPFSRHGIMLVKSKRKRRFIHVHDIAEQIVSYTLSDKTGIYRIMGDKSMTFDEFARENRLFQIPIMNSAIEQRDEE